MINTESCLIMTSGKNLILKILNIYHVQLVQKYGMELLNEKKGFLSEYSQSTAGEDMAETFSFLMIENSKLKTILQSDDILKKK